MIEKTVKSYSHLASEYDRLRFSSVSGQFGAYRDADVIQELVGMTQVKTVYDIPSGTGRVAEYLQDHGVDVVGCDATPEMIDCAREKNLKNQKEFICCDASRIPVEDKSVECIVCLRFFHLFKPDERTPFVQEFDRILCDNGYLVCSFTNGWYGGGLNFLKKTLGFKSVFHLYPGEMKRLFPGYDVIALRGNRLPFQWKISSIHPVLKKMMTKLVSCYPLNRFCWERFYLLRKS